MKQTEKSLIYEYLFSQLARFEDEERDHLVNIRFRKTDAVDCFELARAKDNYIMFLQFAKDIMTLLHLCEDDHDFNVKYEDYRLLIVERERSKWIE
ncbi:MAG: hypothetical protein E7505_04595 [Ruminococcus sp.]|nr:hypothetical protein [Ruminococcus sp.]